MNREELISNYKKICNLLDVRLSDDHYQDNMLIKEILQIFMREHKRVALYCNGLHTHMLMTDFVSDLRDVVCIIDRHADSDNQGMPVIKLDEIDSYGIDAVIISSYKYKEDIKRLMNEKYPIIPVLDIYDELKKRGVFLEEEYYSEGPYRVYNQINKLNNDLDEGIKDRIAILKEILKRYVVIKDFRLAIKVSECVYDLTKKEEDAYICGCLKNIYKMQLSTLAGSSTNNVLLLCLDGMRGSDYARGCLAKVKSVLEKKGRSFERAYSYSTMTFESLVPAFSENTDQNTQYYLNDDVGVDECRFCKTALSQNRDIFVYGDGCKYISGEEINYSKSPQTLSEKIWDFTVDLCSTNNGLFYLHELYESHFSFPNPYTRGKMVSAGTAMLFDFLPQNGGKLKVDYSSQLEDSLRYIDDTLAPFLEALPCALLLFADHGNMALKENATLDEIQAIQLSASEDWVKIPWIVVAGSIIPGEDDSLVSLLDINDVVISLLRKKGYPYKKNRGYIKIGRSSIYNPDFKELYRMLDVGYNGEAYEGFIFEDGFKLMIYANGKKELYSTRTDELVNNQILLEEKYNVVKSELSIF